MGKHPYDLSQWRLKDVLSDESFWKCEERTYKNPLEKKNSLLEKTL